MSNLILESGNADIKSVTELSFGTDSLLPTHSSRIAEVIPHPSIDATLVRIATEIPEALLDDGTIAPIQVDFENELASVSRADVVSWGTDSDTPPVTIPRLLRAGSVLLLSPSACRARVGGEGIVFKNEWVCISDATVQKFCLYEDGAPLFTEVDGEKILLGFYSTFLDSEGGTRDCSIESQQVVVFVAIRSIFAWLNGLASLRPDTTISDDLFNGDGGGLESGEGSVVFPNEQSGSTEVTIEDDLDNDEAISALDFSGRYQLFEGCVESLCCCPRESLSITQSGNELSVVSVFSCGNNTATATIGEFSVDLRLDGETYSLELTDGVFLQAVNRQTLSCSFSAQKV